jgi:RHS repeat-associated protein
VFDGQAGLHQNGYRDLDPAVGRYVESDPIGMLAGVDTYAYVEGNPLNYVDSNGLDKLPPSQVLMLILQNNKSALSTELILCLIYKESTFDPSQKNPHPGNTAWGFMGVTQLATNDLGLNHDDMLDPASNIAAGTQYLNRRITWKKPFGAGFQQPGPAGYISPETKAYLCKLLKQSHGQFQDAWKQADAQRKSDLPASWANPVWQEAENWLYSAGWPPGEMPNGQFNWQTYDVSIALHQLLKYPLPSGHSAPSMGAWLAALEARSHRYQHHRMY